MMVDLNNLRVSMKAELNSQLKDNSEILGFRVVKGPWDKTYILDIETKKANISGLLLDLSKGLEFAGPLKSVSKEAKDESKKSA